MSDNKVTPLQLFLSFMKIGLFTFGGGYAMIPLIEREVIDRRGWVARGRFLELLTLAQTAPGPISLNTAVFVGYNTCRLRGAIAAVTGVVLPSFVILLLIAIYFPRVRDNQVVTAVFKGMRPAVVALIAAPLFGLAKGMNLYRIALAIAAAFAIWGLDVSPVWLLAAGAAAGLGWVARKLHKRRRRFKPDEKSDKKPDAR